MIMNVKLIWVTPNAEELITYMARVSAPKNQENMETAPKLLRYLIQHKHWSPYEMANMCVEINTTRAISAQIIRHRSFSFQEFSARYADVSELGSAVIPHLRRQDHKNRQNSIDDLDTEMVGSYYRRISQLFEDAEHLYREMISTGVAKECARNILPMAAQTRIYMQGSLRSWIHYLQLRCDNGTQAEHRQIAEEIKRIFCQQFPVTGEVAFSGEDNTTQPPEEQRISRLFF
jgi:thymidylate synthase (FAD)